MPLQRFKQYVGLHYIFLLYGLIILGLLIGLLQGYDPTYVLYVVGLYVFPLAGVYFLGHAAARRKNWAESSLLKGGYIEKIRAAATPGSVINALLLSTLSVFAIHGILIGGYPGFRAFWEFDYNTLVDLRKSVTEDVPTLFKYLYSFTIKALIPFGLVFAYVHGKRKHLVAMYLMALLFAFNGMQKSHFMTFFLPLALLLLCQKRYLRSLVIFLPILCSIVLMVFITNPALKYSIISKFIDIEYTLKEQPGEEEVLEKLEKISVGEANEAAVSSIWLRTIYLPGEMVGKWFDAIPAKKPFLHGTGYRLYSRITGQPFHDYSLEMYPVLYPEYAVRGYAGSVNVASFMYDYANFGIPGLVMSGCIMALLLLTVNLAFFGDFTMKIVFNTMPVLMLSSASFTSLLFSGGWGLLIVLYIFFIKGGGDNGKN